MRLLFLIGLGLLGLAFLGGAAEVAVVATRETAGLWLPAGEVWSILWPDSLAAARAEAPWLANPVAESLLQLPAWLLFGLPGGLLAWVGRPHRIEEEGEGPDEESLYLYDSLSRWAREQDQGPDEAGEDWRPDEDAEDTEGDDRAPSDHAHLELDEDDEGDDRAFTEHGYDPPDEDWTPPEENGTEPDRADASTPLRPIPDPPKTGEAQWRPPPPDEESGREK